MDWITTLDDLQSRYGTVSDVAARKVVPTLLPSTRSFLERARFCVISTVGPEGTDGSPRGDEGPVVRILDARTLALPDWRGNQRIDSLRNIIRDPRISLMFLIPGSTIAVRVNGTARLTADPALCQSFSRDNRHPITVVVIAIAEVYPQCARALHRSALWTSGDQSQAAPSIGAMLQEATAGAIDGPALDQEEDEAGRTRAGWW